MQTKIRSMEDLGLCDANGIYLSHYQCQGVQILLVGLCGQMDASNATEIRNRITDRLIDQPPLILFEMQEVTMMDSTGIGSLALVFNLAKFFGGKIAVCSLQRQPQMLFEITNIDKILHIYPTREDFEAAIPSLLEL